MYIMGGVNMTIKRMYTTLWMMLLLFFCFAGAAVSSPVPDEALSEGFPLDLMEEGT